MKHTALYLRVSTEAQADEGYSLAAQAEKLEAYCRMKGIDRFTQYVDGGFSGSNLSRPAVTQLIDCIRRGEVERVVVYKLARLSRSQKDTLYLIEDVFAPHGVDFVSINENIDTGTPYGRAMIGILSAFAQLERENIFLRTRMGMVERVKQGGERFLFPCRHAHDRHAELRLQLRQIDGDALAPRLVEQVHAHDQVRRHAAYLQREHERALQARRVAHDDHGVGLAAAHKVARNGLLCRVRAQGVRARNVHE